MKNVMIDLETLGSNPMAPIVQIGALVFDLETGETSDEVSFRIDLSLDNAFASFKPDSDTIEWWMRQSEAARTQVFKREGRMSLCDALNDLRYWYQQTGDNLPVWSHATFDPPILRFAYEQCSLDFPFNYKCFRDIRTVNAFSGDVTILARERFGEPHEAIADCRHQAHYVSRMLQTFVNVREATMDVPKRDE